MNPFDKSGRMDIGNNHNWCDTSFQRLLVGDFNGDKKSDLLCSNHANIDEGRAYIMLSNGAGFYPISLSPDGKVDVGSHEIFCATPGLLVIGNFDGIYGDDLLCNHPTIGNMLMVSSYNSTSKSTIFRSINGEDMGDIKMGNNQECGAIWCHDPAAKLLSGHFNMDNKADLLCNLNGRNMIMLSTINSTANCDFKAVQYGSSSSQPDGFIKIPTTDTSGKGLSWCDGPTALNIGDIDGDGLTDLVCNNQGQNKIMFCGFKDSYTTFVSINAADPEGDGSIDIANHHEWCLSQSLFMGDVNGDSLSDLWCNQNGGVIG